VGEIIEGRPFKGETMGALRRLESACCGGYCGGFEHERRFEIRFQTRLSSACCRGYCGGGGGYRAPS
jgi:hypothetical protein